MDDLATIEGRLKAALKERFGTQQKGAKELGYSQPELSRWLGGIRDMTAERLAELAGEIGVNGHWLLFGEGDMWARPGEAEFRLDVIRRLADHPGTLNHAVVVALLHDAQEDRKGLASPRPPDQKKKRGP